MMVVDEGHNSAMDPHESDGEDSSAISLCDLPMMDVTQDGSDGQGAAPPPDLFEFFSDGLSIEPQAEMCAADDIFLSGQLLPYKPPPPSPPPPQPPCRAERSDTHEPKALHLRHRRSESLGALDGPRGGIAAECRRLRRAASDSDPARPPPAARPRPKWYLFVFGSVRMPAAMEMRDIRSRQRRRCLTPPSTAESGGWGCEKSRGPWRLLRSLSCKGLGGDSVVVTAPLGSF